MAIENSYTLIFACENHWLSAPHFITQYPALLLVFRKKKTHHVPAGTWLLLPCKRSVPQLEMPLVSCTMATHSSGKCWYSGWFRQLKSTARANVKQHSSVHASGAIENIVETNNRSILANNIAFTDWDRLCREPYVSRKSIMFKFALLRLQNGKFAKSFASTPWTPHGSTTP